MILKLVMGLKDKIKTREYIVSLQTFSERNLQTFEGALKGLSYGVLLAFIIKCFCSRSKCCWDSKRKVSSEFLQGVQSIISFQ